jgi:hypothetical protein
MHTNLLLSKYFLAFALDNAFPAVRIIRSAIIPTNLPAGEVDDARELRAELSGFIYN